MDSLQATIFQHRKDLFTSPPLGTPIPTTPPTETTSPAVDRKFPRKFIFVINKESFKNVFMTATVWEPKQDPTGWWMSEKYDGMRLLWNGSQFVTRQGNVVSVPESLTSQLPKIALDGELW